MPRLGLGSSLTGGAGASEDITSFISTWTTTGSDETVTLPFVSSGSIDFTIKWGDGSSDAVTAYDDDLGEGAIDHVYATAATYIITISGTIRGFKFGGSGDVTKIKTITQWGTFNLSTAQSFLGCSALDISATDAPTVSTTDMNATFRNCTALTNIGGEWDIDGVTNLERCFNDCSNFNGDVTTWDTAEVTTFREIFDGCTVFNQEITRDGDKWDTGEVSNFYLAFGNCTAFNGDVGNWDVAKGNNFNSMFVSCTNFNQDVGSWSVTVGTTFADMFGACTSFNQDLSAWRFKTSGTVSMSSMFNGCTSYNQPMNDWTTAAVTTMARTFYNNDVLNRDLSNWDTGAVTSMYGMFWLAEAFNQDISAWDVTAVANFESFLNGANALSTANYNLLLHHWEADDPLDDKDFHGGDATTDTTSGSVDGTAARARLVDNHNWTITDGD